MDPGVSEQLSKNQCTMSLFVIYLLVNWMDVSALRRRAASTSKAVFMLRQSLQGLASAHPH